MLWTHVRNMLWQTNTYTYECVQGILVMPTFCTFQAVKYFTHNAVTIAQYVCFSGENNRTNWRKKKEKLSLNLFPFFHFCLYFLNIFIRFFCKREREWVFRILCFNASMMVQFALAHAVEHIKLRALKSMLRFSACPVCAKKYAMVCSALLCKRIKSSKESAICCSKWIRIVEPLARQLNNWTTHQLTKSFWPEHQTTRPDNQPSNFQSN